MQVPSLKAATAPWATTDFKSARTSSGQIATPRLTATLKPTHANWKDAGGINIHSVMLKERICPTCALRDSSAPMKKMPVRAKCLSVALANWIAMVSGSLSYETGLSFDDTTADQCQPPGDTSLVDTSAHGLNTNGSVCLNGVCQYVISLSRHKPDVLIAPPDMPTWLLDNPARWKTLLISGMRAPTNSLTSYLAVTVESECTATLSRQSVCKLNS